MRAVVLSDDHPAIDSAVRVGQAGSTRGGAQVREYTFVSITVKRRREGAALEKDHREVIRERAAAGWEFVQAIPLDTHTEPRLDLVFSRKVKK